MVNYFLFTEFGFPCCLAEYETDTADVQFNFGDRAHGVYRLQIADTQYWK